MIIKIDKNKPVPMYTQIKEELKRLINEGRFKPHEKLPPTRALSKSLNISRNTIIQSYSLLEAEGFVYSKTGKGTFVNPTAIKKDIKKRRQSEIYNFNFNNLLSVSWKQFETSLFSGFENLIKFNDNADIINFDSPNPEANTLPIDNFKSSIINSIKKYGSKLFSSINTEGFDPLRKYLSSYLIKRAIHIEFENILITSGIQQGLSLIGRLLLDPGDIVILENLTYPGALSVFRSLQSYCIGIPTDINGIDIDILEKVLKRKRVKILYTIPTYHNPLGNILSLERRKTLVKLSEKYGFAIIEDDYAHELCFSGKEETPIKAFDSSDSIFYLGSFSETLFPGIRLSWIVAQKQIIKKLSSLKASSDLYTNPLLQAAVLDFMEKGYFEKHLKRLNKILSKRNEAMNYALSMHLPKKVNWSRVKGGLYTWVNLPSEIDSIDLLLKTREKGVIFTPDRLFAVEDWGHSGFRLTFNNIDEDKIWHGIEIIGKTLKSMLKGD